MIINLNRRFEALDAWRGIAACMIVLFHFNNAVRNHLENIALINNASLFVDFFFVLSGFVICRTYQQRLLQGFPIRNYIFLRLGRIYPMHLLMLSAFVGLELMKFVLPSNLPPFSTDFKSVTSLIGNFFLIHSLGIFHTVTWNSPSWSISTEFYTYIIYALALMLFRSRIGIAASVAALIIPVIFLFNGFSALNMTAQHGLWRCVYGFSFGILAQYGYTFLSKKGCRFGTVAEIILVIAVGFFIAFAGKSPLSFLAPPVFFVCVIIFSFESGKVRTLLKTRPFQTLGKLSYSIYMVHSFIQILTISIAHVFEKVLHLHLVENITKDGGYSQEILNLNQWQGDLLQVILFAVTVIASAFTFRWVENPANKWARAYVERHEGASGPKAESAAW